jgi:hypothetical protein
MKSSTSAAPCWLTKNGFDWLITSQSLVRIQLTETTSLPPPTGALPHPLKYPLPQPEKYSGAPRRGLPAPRSSSGGRFSFSIGNPKGALAACASRRPTGADNTPVCAYGPCASRALHAYACVCCPATHAIITHRASDSISAVDLFPSEMRNAINQRPVSFPY